MLSRWLWNVINNISGGGEMSREVKNNFLCVSVDRISFLASIYFLLFCPAPVFADDAAVSVKAGGIEFKRELRISMEKEVLTIGQDKISVEYEFLNESKENIATEVAFPVPRFAVFDSDCGPRSTFNDFRVWVDGNEIEYATEDRATLGAKDYTELLHKLKLNIGTFGEYWGPAGKCDNDSSYQILHLSAEQKGDLIQAGLLGKDDVPMWSVQRKFYWQQFFPAGKTIHVRHEYKPVPGYRYALLDDLDPVANGHRISDTTKKSLQSSSETYDLEMLRPIQNACIEPSLLQTLSREVEGAYGPEKKGAEYNNRYLEARWVDFILKTANFWKTPIKEFELIVERPATSSRKFEFVSFCWDGEVRGEGPDRFVAKAKNFVPQKDLTIMFLRVHPPESRSIGRQ